MVHDQSKKGKSKSSFRTKQSFNYLNSKYFFVRKLLRRVSTKEQSDHRQIKILYSVRNFVFLAPLTVFRMYTISAFRLSCLFPCFQVTFYMLRCQGIPYCFNRVFCCYTAYCRDIFPLISLPSNTNIFYQMALHECSV